MIRERRRSFRVEWNSPATIHDGGLDRPCILANFSNTGAKITGVVPATIPDEFTLSITPRGRKRKCRVRWRYGEAVGIEFTDRSEMPEEANTGSDAREPALARIFGGWR